MNEMEQNRAVTVVKAMLAVPTFAALAAASIAVHTSISAAVLAYNIMWRRRQHRLNLLRRELGPGIYYAN
jgi:hypothetical protein